MGIFYYDFLFRLFTEIFVVDYAKFLLGRLFNTNFNFFFLLNVLHFYIWFLYIIIYFFIFMFFCDFIYELYDPHADHRIPVFDGRRPITGVFRGNFVPAAFGQNCAFDALGSSVQTL